MLYRSLVRPWLFRQDAETAHDTTFGLLKRAYKVPGAGRLMATLYRLRDPRLQTELFGITFPNPVGLAAGLDKNALLLPQWEALGLGFVEVGTITPKAQEGNPKPRLFRLPQDRALINRMGFNNDGLLRISRRLELRPLNLVVGANIGKNKHTPNESAANDYRLCVEGLHHCCDYFVVNVSSPNTPGLRELQEPEALKRILGAVQERNHALGKPRPILLKIAPDLAIGAVDQLIEVAQENLLAGIVATNTTIERQPLTTDAAQVQDMGAGGLSGYPLAKRSTEIVRYIAGAGIPVVGVGGILTAQDALAKFQAGAQLVQLYSGYVYEGPALVKRILKALLRSPDSLAALPKPSFIIAHEPVPEV